MPPPEIKMEFSARVIVVTADFPPMETVASPSFTSGAVGAVGGSVVDDVLVVVAVGDG